VTNKKPTGDEPSAPAAAPSSDVALIHGPTADGEGLRILRARDNRLEIGAIRPLREGAPITGEVVTLRPRPSFPALCDVEVNYKPPVAPSDRQELHAALPHHGPAQVATEDYRKNWDAIWSQPASKAKLVT
jgi:hypothetical protein